VEVMVWIGEGGSSEYSGDSSEIGGGSTASDGSAGGFSSVGAGADDGCDSGTEKGVA